MRVGGALGFVGCVMSIFALACGGQSIHEGELGGAGGSAGGGPTQLGSGSWTGGTVNPGAGGAPVDIEGLLKGFAGVNCVDDEKHVSGDPVGILTRGTVLPGCLEPGLGCDTSYAQTDYCDSNGNLIEYFCDGHCARGFPDGHDCTFNGGAGFLVVTCNGRCLDGACAPLSE
jgi:hypothetical protein